MLEDFAQRTIHFLNSFDSTDLNNYVIISFLVTIVLLVYYYLCKIITSCKIDRGAAWFIKTFSIICCIGILFPIYTIIDKYFEIYNIVPFFYSLPGIAGSLLLLLCNVGYTFSCWHKEELEKYNFIYLAFSICYYLFFGIFYFLGLFDFSRLFFQFYLAFIIPSQIMILITVTYAFIMFILFSETTDLA